MAHEKAFAIGLGMDISKGPRIGSWQKTNVPNSPPTVGTPGLGVRQPEGETVI
jgi:hypothetical protein